MVSFRALFGQINGAGARSTDDDDLGEHLLPTHHRDHLHTSIPAKRVTKVALRLKFLIEAAVPCELKESQVTRPHSHIITKQIVLLAQEAGGTDDKSCVVFCLLVCLRWFKRQAKIEIYDAELYLLRAEACQVIAKRLIESIEDNEYLFHEVLLKRYNILINGRECASANAVERAVDLHATRIIGSSGYQKCINYLWRGWVAQDLNDPTQFCAYENVANKSFWAHFDHDRLRTPKYQNAFQVLVSVIYLAMYTLAINSVNPTGDIDVAEGFLYLLTAAFIADEMTKFWKVGRFYITFWNTFNLTLYSALTVSFVLRMVALSKDSGSTQRQYWDLMSYNWLAFVAPMFWARMLLFLDTIKFFGAMLVVLKVMMMESLIFFALLVVIIIGFLQGFVGLDNADNKKDASFFILESMTKAILQSPEFEGFDNFAHPFGIILYYLFTFVVMVILLNVLIALYNQAYTDITENAVDEYLALFAGKTLQFVRAPDENVFLPPFNLIEIFLLVLPFEWWMEKKKYQALNDHVMRILYSPFMLLIAFIESRQAQHVSTNRARGEQDDDSMEEWEELEGADILGEGWSDKVEKTVPDIEQNPAIVGIQDLRSRLDELTALVLKKGGSSGSDDD